MKHLMKKPKQDNRTSPIKLLNDIDTQCIDNVIDTLHHNSFDIDDVDYFNNLQINTNDNYEELKF